MAGRIYVGVISLHSGEVFRSTTTPTWETHPYTYTIGPFRTIRGAKAMLWYGPCNPHIQCVADAERIGKKYAKELRTMGKGIKA